MPAEVAPPELARLIDYAERSRVGDWSLRSALCRYAQPQPVRVSTVLDLVRRIDFALHPHTKLLDRDGPALWEALGSGTTPSEPAGLVVGLLGAMVELDHLGDTLADWAADRTGKHPEDAVDATTADVARRLAELGVPHEERTRPPGSRGGRGV